MELSFIFNVFDKNVVTLKITDRLLLVHVSLFIYLWVARIYRQTKSCYCVSGSSARTLVSIRIFYDQQVIRLGARLGLGHNVKNSATFRASIWSLFTVFSKISFPRRISKFNRFRLFDIAWACASSFSRKFSWCCVLGAIATVAHSLQRQNCFLPPSLGNYTVWMMIVH